MIACAHRLERLVFTPSRNARLALLRQYFQTQPDPDIIATDTIEAVWHGVAPPYLWKPAGLRA